MNEIQRESKTSKSKDTKFGVMEHIEHELTSIFVKRSLPRLKYTNNLKLIIKSSLKLHLYRNNNHVTGHP